MRTPTAVLDLEIGGKFTELNDIGDFVGALVLFRLHGRPLGWGAAPVTEGRLDRGALVRQLLADPRDVPADPSRPRHART